MPPAVQKGLSVTILTALSTSTLLMLFGWFGDTALKARDTNTIQHINIEANQKFKKELMTKIDALLQITTKNNIAIHENIVRVTRNERDIEQLRKRVQK